MPKRPAAVTEADVARVIRAARLPYLSKQTTRHGSVAWYVRFNGARMRVRGEFGTVEFLRAYAAALYDILGPTTDAPKAEPESKPRRLRQTTGHVYFVRDGMRVKIGFAVDVKARIATLQTGSSSLLSVIHSRPGDMRDEASFHKQFAHLRIIGEWFRYEAELREFLEPYDPVIEL